MIISHKFVENELTPERVLGLKPSLFNKKTSCLALIARYFLCICRTQEKPLEMGNFKSFALSFCSLPLNVPHASVNLVIPTSIAR